MKGVEDFKENVVKFSLRWEEDTACMKKERGAVHSKNKNLLEINHLRNSPIKALEDEVAYISQEVS